LLAEHKKLVKSQYILYEWRQQQQQQASQHKKWHELKSNSSWLQHHYVLEMENIPLFRCCCCLGLHALNVAAVAIFIYAGIMTTKAFCSNKACSNTLARFPS